MNKIKYILSLIFLIITSFLFSQTSNFTLSGIILDSKTKLPIQAVHIQIGKQSTHSNHKGEFEIKNLGQETHKIRTKYYNLYKDFNNDIYIDKDTSIIILLSERPFQLDEVVITGTRTERPLSKSPILTKIIRESEIKKFGSTSILESLQDNIPGFLTSPNPMGNNIRIKGLNSRHILFLVDGERLISESGGGNINFDQIDINEIQKIEIIDGATSALYGSNALGGVINIITKMPNQNNRIESDFEVHISDNKTLTTKASLGSSYKKISLRANILRNYSQGFNVPKSTLATNPFLDNGAGLKLGFHLNKKLNFDISGRYFRHELFNLKSDQESVLKHIHYLNHNFTSTFNTNYKSVDSKYLLNFSINYNKFIRDQIFELLNNQNERDNELDYISTRALNTFNPSKKIEILAGLEHNYEKNYSESLLGPSPTEKDMHDFSAFCQLNYKILKSLEVNIGARESYNSQYKSSFTPKVSAMYQIANIKLRAGIGTAFRSPTIKELHYNFNNQGLFWIYGNPKLKPENGTYYSLSGEYTKEALNAYISCYHNKIENKIVIYDSISNLGSLGKYYKNTASASLTGFDIGLYYNPIKQIVLRTNYSFCQGIDNFTKKELLGNIKHSSSISICWSDEIYKSSYSILLAARLSSPNKYLHYLTNEVAEIKKVYNIWKLVLTKPIHFKNDSLIISFKIDNIFNFTEESLIDPGRLFSLGVRYNLR